MRFRPNVPVETMRPTVVVDGGLEPGRYRFQLVVVDAAGNRSRPAYAVVTVAPRRMPVAGIECTGVHEQSLQE